MLLPVDLMILAKILLKRQESWGQMSLARELGISSRTVNECLKRAAVARLYDPLERRVWLPAFEEVLKAAKFFFAPERGTLTRGVRTSWAAEPIASMVTASAEPPPIWPYPEGDTRGIAFKPLHPSVPSVAKKDPQLYEVLAMIDVLREGRARESALALEALNKVLRR